MQLLQKHAKFLSWNYEMMNYHPTFFGDATLSLLIYLGAVFFTFIVLTYLNRLN